MPSCFERPASGFQRPPPFGVPVAEGMLQSYPPSGVILSLPAILLDYLPHPLPSASTVARYQLSRKASRPAHIGYLPALQSPSELVVLSVEDVPNHRPEWDFHLYGPLDQLQGYPGLGAKGTIRIAALEVVGRSVGFDPQGIVEPFVGKQAGERNHPIFYLCYTPQVLLANVSGGLALLAYSTVCSMTRAPDSTGVISGSSSINSTLCAGSHRPRIPSRLREQPLQRLCASLCWAPATGSVLARAV